MLLNKIRNIFCVPNTKFVSATNAARAGKRGNICLGNDVSATMCPRLPGPLDRCCSALEYNNKGSGVKNRAERNKYLREANAKELV